ncbi:MAG: carbohydrate ABC transporter permease [Clostridiales bacterium]|jgi:putative aldouronate transport system permease protein|nr:carbohydrate ABC transporter permease [Clostridiales bacterium]
MAVNDRPNPIAQMLRYTIVAILTFIFVFPFYVVVVIAFNDPIDLMNGYPLFWPNIFSTANFNTIFHSAVLPRAAFLSVSRTVLGTIVSVVGCGMTAYCLSREDLPGKKFFNNFFLFVMFFGGGLIPTYIMLNKYGLINNFLVFILPAFVNVYYMLIIKSYYVGLPKSVEEAAIIDGCGEISVFFRIVIPMAVPVLAAIAVYSAVGQWNSWWDNYIWANKQSLCTLQLLLVRLIKEADTTTLMSGSAFSSTTQTSPFGVRMAATVIVTFPILIAYPFFQKYFISGITIGAVKG